MQSLHREILRAKSRAHEVAPSGHPLATSMATAGYYARGLELGVATDRSATAASDAARKGTGEVPTPATVAPLNAT